MHFSAFFMKPDHLTKSVMNSRYLIALSMLLLNIQLYAQLKTFIGLETGPSWNYVQVIDPGSYYTNAGLFATFNGITIEQEVISNLSIGTGIYFQTFRDGMKMIDERPGTAGWDLYSSFLLPVRLKYRILIPGSPVSFTPVFGYLYGLSSGSVGPYTGNSILSAPDDHSFDYSISRSDGDRNLHMFETGFTLGFTFPGDWQVGLNLVYAKGFAEQYRSELTYTDQNRNTRNATCYSYGDFFRTSASLLVPVSNGWQNIERRKRNRIEKTFGGGTSVKDNTEIYFGAEAGTLWRLFHHTNPALVPRPMDNRGVFRYSNFRTGAYAGIMLNSHLGLDAGVYYQRSGTFFAVMYDHETDFTVKAPAPLFLEIPLKLRYFYELISHQLDLAVYAGGSLVTHFSSDVFGSGGGSFTYYSPLEGPEYSGTVNYTASRTSRFGGTLKAGLGVEYILPINFPLIVTFYADYTHGYIKIDEIALTTSFVEFAEAPSQSYISCYGSGWNLSLGLKIPFIITPKGTNKCGRLPRTK